MDNIMDPELASEMVKLLAQELKTVRTHLREAEMRTSTPHTSGLSNGLNHERAQALISENQTLRADNVALQERIAKLQDELTRVSPVKSEEVLLSALQRAEPTSHMSGEFARLLAENEVLTREKEEVLRSQEKLSILQEKYRRSKAKVHEYNEMLNELRVALRSCAEELEQSRKSVIPEIDFRGILQALPYEPVENQLEFSSIQPCNRHIHTEVYKDAMDFSEGLYFINCNEVVWSPSGIALGLVIKPTFQYNPKILGGAWTKLEDSFDVGRRIDLCCLSGKSGKTSRYLGIYERAADQGTMIVASETLKHLDREKLDYASKRTTLFPDLVPPSQTQMIKNMYKQGVIKLQCFAIRCVGINQTFVEKLLDAATSPAQRNPSDGIVTPALAATSRDARKRKQGTKWTGHSTKSFKKRCGPLHATGPTHVKL